LLSLGSDCPVELWREALRLATQVTNMMYIRDVGGENKTAYEVLFKRKPDIARFQPFGVDCVAFVPVELQGKKTRSYGSEYGKDLAPRGHRAIYLGEAPIYIGGVDEMRSQQGSIVYDLDKHEVRVAVKVLVRQHTFHQLKEYRKRTTSKDKLIPGTVFDVLTLNDYVEPEAQVVSTPDEYIFQHYMGSEAATPTKPPEPVTPQKENTATGNPDDKVIQEDNDDGISSRVKKRARKSKVSFAEMDGSSAEEEDADNSSTLVANQEENFEEENQPRSEEEQWTMEDADKVIDSVADVEEISSSYHDINESVLGKRGVGVGVGGQRKSPRRRFKKDDIPYIHDVDNNVRTSRRSIFGNESAPKRQKIGINAVSVLELKLMGSDVKVPNTVLEALNSSYADFWRDAMKAEMDSQLERKVFEPVERSEVNKDATVVDTRWVFAVKTDSEGYVNRFKARLVARGFTQVEVKDYGDVYAPVVGIEDVRVLCALAAIKRMNMKSFDVKTAFLNAPIDHDILIKMPKGTKDYDDSGKPQLYQVLRALYGLRQAPKQWYDMFMDAELIALELVRAKVDRVRSLLQELEYPVTRATPIFEDHRGLRDAAHGIEAYGGSSSLNKKLLNIRTAVTSGSILVKEIDTKDQLADFLTKTFPRSKLQEVVSTLGYDSIGR
jgi:hypothetical protein